MITNPLWEYYALQYEDFRSWYHLSIDHVRYCVWPEYLFLVDVILPIGNFIEILTFYAIFPSNCTFREVRSNSKTKMLAWKQNKHLAAIPYCNYVAFILKAWLVDRCHCAQQIDWNEFWCFTSSCWENDMNHCFVVIFMKCFSYSRISKRRTKT